MKCPKCKGIKLNLVACNFCYGKEDLDWLEIIIGVDEIKIWYPLAGFKRGKISIFSSGKKI